MTLKFLDFIQSCGGNLDQVRPCLPIAHLKVSPEAKDKIWPEKKFETLVIVF